MPCRVLSLFILIHFSLDDYIIFFYNKSIIDIPTTIGFYGEVFHVASVNCPAN